jgi:hypothetical protein
LSSHQSKNVCCNGRLFFVWFFFFKNSFAVEADNTALAERGKIIIELVKTEKAYVQTLQGQNKASKKKSVFNNNDFLSTCKLKTEFC